MPPRLPPLTLIALVVCAACGGAATCNTSDPSVTARCWEDLGISTKQAVSTQIAALPVTQSYLESEYAKSLTATALPPQQTATTQALQLADFAITQAWDNRTATAVAQTVAYSQTAVVMTLRASDAQKHIAENNAAIANSGIVTDGSKYLCMGIVGVFVFGFLVLVCVTMRQYQLWLDELRRVKGNRMWRQLAIDYRPRIAAPNGYKPEPPRNLSAESRLRAACKVYVDACVTLAQGGVKHPFSRPTALTYGLVTNPATGEVWQSGHDVIIKTLTGAGVFANTGKGGRTEFAAGWDYDRFKREFDITPLPPMDEGPIPAAKIMLAGSQVGQVFAGSQV